jgi:3-hydroxybutyryl-CoA dehydrogenase
MTIAVLADAEAREEFSRIVLANSVETIFADSVRSLGIIEADACFDLMFQNDRERIFHLRGIASQRPVIVNSVPYTCNEIGSELIRLNAWPTMLGRSVAEVAVANDGRQAISLFEALGWPVQIVPDVPGMITPRIVSMIINEAYFAVGEGVGTPAAIDEAMRLGTNYPFGPFEWLRLIGRDRIIELLTILSEGSPRYAISPALLNNSGL